MYDDPVVTAKRILALSKDEPWAQKELAELVPLLLEEIERLEKQAENEYWNGHSVGYDEAKACYYTGTE